MNGVHPAGADVRRRRQEVKRLREMGLGNDEIATRLGVSLTTITYDIAALGLAGAAGKRTNGKLETNPVRVVTRLVGQLDDLAETLEPLVRQLRMHDYDPDPDLLESWAAMLDRRNNITAVVSRLRNYMKENS